MAMTVLASPVAGSFTSPSRMSDAKSGGSNLLDPYDPFFIPRNILNSPSSNQPAAPLLHLPPELLVLIIQHVQIPYFQVCLALTCKNMGRIASKKKVLSPWRGYRDKDGLFRLLERKQYIPKTLRLCRACFTFVPRDPRYWINKMDDDFDAKDVNWYDVLNFFDKGSSQQHRCPLCCIKHYVSFVSESFYMEGRETPGSVEDITRSICPDLHRRVDKP